VTFTIENSGNAALNLTGSPRVSVSGANPGDFVVTAIPGASVAAGGSTTFQVTFRPSAIGLRQATISIANNDSDESNYSFAVQGMGLVPVAPLHNEAFPQDVDGNGNVTPFDLLAVVNRLLSPTATPQASGAEPMAATPSLFVDVNGDGRVTPNDALQVINFLLADRTAAPVAAPTAAPQVAEAVPADELASQAVDVAIGLLNRSSTTEDASSAVNVVSNASESDSAPAAPTLAPTPQSVRAVFAANSKKTPADDQADDHDDGLDWSLEI
jgi:hypothetical protein